VVRTYRPHGYSLLVHGKCAETVTVIAELVLRITLPCALLGMRGNNRRGPQSSCRAHR
jgi:hypothetical protein